MGSPEDPRLARLKKKALSVVQTYSLKLQEAHAAFVSRAWPTSISRKDPLYLAWKFRSDSEEEIESLLLAVDNNKVVGQLGLIPAQVKIGGQIIEAQWGCNFKVLRELEGAGYGSLLDIQSLAKKPITLGAAPSRQSEDIKIKLGFKALEGPRIMAYPIDFHYFTKLKLPKLPVLLSKVLSAGAKVIYKAIYFRNYGTSSNTKPEILKGSYHDVIHLIQACRSKIQIPHIIHDEKYLHWRCRKVQNYREGALSLSTASGSFILYYPTTTYCYLYEYNFVNPAEQRNLLLELLNIALKIPSKALYTYVNDPQEEEAFKRFGFFGFRRKIKVYVHAANGELLSDNLFHMNVYDSDSGI